MAYTVYYAILFATYSIQERYFYFKKTPEENKPAVYVLYVVLFLVFEQLPVTKLLYKVGG